MTRNESLRIGDLARRAGVTVRTLHHYDEIGLLRPAAGGAGQQRRYGPREVARLLQIRALSGLGLSLAEIREALDGEDTSPLQLVEARLTRITEEIEVAQILRARLEHLADTMRARQDPSVEDLLQTMEAMTMFEKYYTAEQLRYLEERRELVGEARIREVQQEWQDLFAEFRAAQARGDDPARPAVQALSERARALVAEFSGGDAGIERSLADMYAREPAARDFAGAEPELWEYMGRARAAAGGAPEE